MIDKQMRFIDHANTLIKTIAFKLNFLFRSSFGLSQWTKCIIYNTIILPHFNYCSTILFLLNQNELNRLQKLQNRAMPIILSCSKYTSINLMLETLRWMPFKSLLLRNALIFIYQIKHGLLPMYLTEKLS